MYIERERERHAYTRMSFTRAFRGRRRPDFIVCSQGRAERVVAMFVLASGRATNIVNPFCRHACDSDRANGLFQQKLA